MGEDGRASPGDKKKREKERVRDGDDTVETGKVIGTKVWHLLTE